ncbi:MAG: HAMP domain-containing protein [Candidatus Omnitrophica bacterium]|nr:HAMP domain-containing protein [Candidatus Omnitrophota bacterium]
MRIRSKFVTLFLCMTLVPVLFIGYIVFYNSQKSLEEQVINLLNANASLKAQAISDYFQERKGDLYVLQNRENIKTALPVLDQFRHDPTNPSYVEVKRNLDEQMPYILKGYGYASIQLLNPKGHVVYVSSPDRQAELYKLDDEGIDILQKAKTGIQIGEVEVSRNKEHPYVLELTGTVVGVNDEFLGFVQVELSMNSIYAMLKSALSFGDTMDVLLVKKTADNKVLFLSPLRAESEAILKKTVDIGSEAALPAQKAVLGETGFGFSVDYSGHKVLSSWRDISELGWGLVAKVDVSEAFLPIRKLFKIVFVLLGLVIVLLIVTALAVARSIAQPIVKLCRESELIGRGQWDHRLDISGKDEIGDLARAFQDMARNLKFFMQKEKEFVLADARVEAEKEKANELRAINQQLMATEQQLRAANQQLSAGEQQLRASNEQLRANEQQLRAANQQLSAIEQELRAAKTSLEEKVRERTRELEEARNSLESTVEAQTRELREQMENLSRMNKFMVDREMRVIDLKKEVNRLCKELGRTEPYSGGIS